MKNHFRIFILKRRRKTGMSKRKKNRNEQHRKIKRIAKEIKKTFRK